jgi:hypothetical protein
MQVLDGNGDEVRSVSELLRKLLGIDCDCPVCVAERSAPVAPPAPPDAMQSAKQIKALILDALSLARTAAGRGSTTTKAFVLEPHAEAVERCVLQHVVDRYNSAFTLAYNLNALLPEADRYAFSRDEQELMTVESALSILATARERAVAKCEKHKEAQPAASEATT